MCVDVCVRLCANVCVNVCGLATAVCVDVCVRLCANVCGSVMVCSCGRVDWCVDLSESLSNHASKTTKKRFLDAVRARGHPALFFCVD